MAQRFPPALSNRTYQPGTYPFTAFPLELGEQYIQYRLDLDTFRHAIGESPYVLFVQISLSLDGGATWSVLTPFSSTSALEGEIIWSEDTIGGHHFGPDNSATLSDPLKTWIVDEHVGKTIKNVTDGSTGVIAGNTANTITATLSGGTDNDWDNADEYIFGNPLRYAWVDGAIPRLIEPTNPNRQIQGYMMVSNTTKTGLEIIIDSAQIPPPVQP